ncbi:UNVERIFIED_CONTAM: hypothetical protein PYX00_010205 [Menopon gallinae]|uniref:Uncharacterized protein n=1 Tax=Menopon gallinae TaxID=328185 RepID=A0AAW2HEP1_9NEOP
MMFLEPEPVDLGGAPRHRSSMARQSRIFSKRRESSIHWKLDDELSDTESLVEVEEEEELKGEDDTEDLTGKKFCCHSGCSFVYNVQENCLSRPSFILESVPFGIYLKLAAIFRMKSDKEHREDDSNRCKIADICDDDEEVEEFIHLVETEMGFRSSASVDEHVEVGTLRDTIKAESPTEPVMFDNPYLKYLRRHKSTRMKDAKKVALSRRSENITRLIIRDFLDWFKSIGGEEDQMTIDENVLHDLFQIGLDSPTARAITLSIREMPVVPESLANFRREPEFAVKRALKQLLKKDIAMERLPPKLFAFGTMLPKEEPPLRFQPPKNNVKKTWTECQRVPPELESLRVVWEGIENLRSTIAFSNWLKQHKEIPPPKYLEEKGLLNIDYEEWMQMFKDFEMEVETEGMDTDSKQRDLPEEPVPSAVAFKSESMFARSNYSLNWRHQ